MTQIVLRSQAAADEEPCGFCGRPTGSQLVVAETAAPVCPECGRRHAPELTALLDLADTARRIGRIGRHSVFPPLGALLDLASAAEKYTAAQARVSNPPGSCAP
jgi:hypothetical protein